MANNKNIILKILIIFAIINASCATMQILPDPYVWFDSIFMNDITSPSQNQIYFYFSYAMGPQSYYSMREGYSFLSKQNLCFLANSTSNLATYNTNVINLTLVNTLSPIVFTQNCEDPTGAGLYFPLNFYYDYPANTFYYYYLDFKLTNSGSMDATFFFSIDSFPPNPPPVVAVTNYVLNPSPYALTAGGIINYTIKFTINSSNGQITYYLQDDNFATPRTTPTDPGPPVTVISFFKNTGTLNLKLYLIYATNSVQVSTLGLRTGKNI